MESTTDGYDNNTAYGFDNVQVDKSFRVVTECAPVPGKFLGIVGQDPSDSTSSRLHVDIFRCCFHSCGVYYSIDSSKMIGNSPEVSNSNSTGSSVTKQTPVLSQQRCAHRPDLGTELGLVLYSTHCGSSRTRWPCHHKACKGSTLGPT